MLQLGFDIGGTHIGAGLVTAEGMLLAAESQPFPHGLPAVELVALLAQQATRLCQRQGLEPAQLHSIGIGVPGTIDPSGSMLLDAYNIGLCQVPLREMLQQLLPAVPIRLINDASAAALAEFCCGALRGCQTGCMVTLGTGVGCGLILAGKLFTGGRRSGVQWSHSALIYGGEACSCGQLGCIESYCSATALVQQAKLRFSPDSLLFAAADGTPEKLTAKLVVDCVRAGDAAAVQVFHTYLDYLAMALANLVNLLDPQIIAIGGGLSQAGDILFQPLRVRLLEKCFISSSGNILPASMGNDAGIIGAALLHRHLAS